MQLSFRDPDGFVFRSGDRIFRCVFPHAVRDVRSFLVSDFAAASVSEGILADTRILGDASDPGVPVEVRQNVADGSLIVEQTPIAFATIPMSGRLRCCCPPQISRCALRELLWPQVSR